MGCIELKIVGTDHDLGQVTTWDRSRPGTGHDLSLHVI
jgi:hypothetical protein